MVNLTIATDGIKLPAGLNQTFHIGRRCRSILGQNARVTDHGVTPQRKNECNYDRDGQAKYYPG